MRKILLSKFFRKIGPAGLIGLFFLFASTHFAHADVPSAAGLATNFFGSVMSNISYYFIGKVAFGISYIIAWIGGVSISIEAWLVGAMLGINQGVFQSDIVQKGFGATLSIANLGFILGIIIVAVSTILRRETYGDKKILWKLIAAAILVNFSLVIAAPVFNLGNSFTQYFLSCIDPGGGGCGSSTNGLTSLNNFAAGLAGAFNPQVGLLSSSALGTNLNNLPNSVSLGQSLGQMLVPILSIAFVAFELITTAIVLATLVIMLLIRYVYIAILAILMPFAWLGWVFPNLKGWWSKWWENFIRWTFFAPIVVFFLWLAMITTQSMRNGTAIANQQFGTYTSTSNGIWGPIASLLTTAFSSIIAQSLNIFLMIGLTIGGLVVADRMSITGAKAGIGAAQTFGRGVGNFVGKQAKKGARATYQKAGGQRLTSALQEGRIGALKYIPLGRRAASLAGRGISSISGNEALVEEAKKKVPKNPDEIRANLRGSMNTEDQYAHIAKLVETGELRTHYKDKEGNLKDEMVNGKTMREYLNENLAKDSDVAQRFGQVKMGGDADKAVGGDKAVRMAEDQLKAAVASNAGIAAIAAATNKLDDAMGEFISKMQKSDIAKLNVNEVFQHDTDLSRAILKQFALKAPQLVTAALPKMKANNLLKLDETYKDVIKDAFLSGTAAEQERLVGKNKQGALATIEDPSPDSVLGKYKKAFGTNATGFATGASGGGGGTSGGDAH